MDEWKRRRNFNTGDEVEYYEDTHNERGEYVGRKVEADRTDFGASNAPQFEMPQFSAPKYTAFSQPNQSGFTTPTQPTGFAAPTQPTGFTAPHQPQPQPLPNKSQYIAQRYYQNVVVYEPRSPEDVQTLIDYLKRREPAIINLDAADEQISQRILDFVSGAIYALNGSVHRVAGNIFLLSPEGVEITVPYEI